MSEISDRFTQAIAELGSVADVVTSQDALGAFDDVTLQTFWREWPHISSWAGALWRSLSEDLEAASQPVADPDLDEVGGAG